MYCGGKVDDWGVKEGDWLICISVGKYTNIATIGHIYIVEKCVNDNNFNLAILLNEQKTLRLYTPVYDFKFVKAPNLAKVLFNV